MVEKAPQVSPRPSSKGQHEEHDECGVEESVAKALGGIIRRVRGFKTGLVGGMGVMEKFEFSLCRPMESSSGRVTFMKTRIIIMRRHSWQQISRWSSFKNLF